MSQTRLLPADDTGKDGAAAILRAGGLVAMPTETVYGLAADARSDVAVARIFEAKGRPRFNPLIVHLPDIATARRLVKWDDRAEAVAQAFWPGPLTLVLPLAENAGLSPLVTAGLDSVALRVPAHPLARDLLLRFGGPLAAPSANPSGRVSPTEPAHVMEALDGRIEAVLDGGPCAVGVESTILGLTHDTPRLLRPGGLPAEALAEVLGEMPQPPEAAAGITAPGQMTSHYAPRGRVRLEAIAPEPGETYLGFGPLPAGAEGAMTLSASGDLVEAAARLFHCLHELDRAGAERIAVAPVPDRGLGRAINDRLRRAAAPRGGPESTSYAP
ncbi:L-threonylcarbamoyladenylate synthase [Pseudooceanicola sp. 502str34]